MSDTPVACPDCRAIYNTSWQQQSPTTWQCGRCSRTVTLETDTDGERTQLVHRHEEKHSGRSTSEYIKDIIYGGLDGIISVFVTVAAGTGSSESVYASLVLGIAKWFAGALSMGVGDWLATDAEVDMAKRERSREAWELENNPEGEVEEMVELYMKKGVPEANARRIMEILSRHPEAFISVMMAEELGISSGQEQATPWKNGLATFLAFLVFGIVPLLACTRYGPPLILTRLDVAVILINLHYHWHQVRYIAFYVAIVMTVLTLLGMAIWKAAVTGSSYIKSIIVTLLLGSGTAAIGWLTTFLLHKYVPGAAGM